MKRHVMLTKSDIDSLNYESEHHGDSLLFKIDCLIAISIKMHAFIQNNIAYKDLFYNKINKLSYFCDESFNVEYDEDILILEDSGVQYSYIKRIIKGVPEMMYVCQIYDDTYMSRIYYNEEDKTSTVFKLLKSYNYEYGIDIEYKIKDKIINRITNELKHDLKYRFIVEEYFSGKSNILDRLNERDIIEAINSLVNLDYDSMYLAIYEEVKAEITFELERELKRLFPAYNIQKKSLNKYEEEIYEYINGLTKESVDKILSGYFRKGVFLLNDLYKVTYNIGLNIAKYNNIIRNIKYDIIEQLNENKCEMFEIQYYDKIILCQDIRDVSDNEEYDTNWYINDLVAINKRYESFNVTPRGESFEFNRFEIIHNLKTIYELSREVWNDLCEIKVRISNLQEEQLTLAKSIVGS